MLFWRNPEFIRHMRAELRRGRMLAVGSVVLLVCGLALLGSWASLQNDLENMTRASAQFDGSWPGRIRALETDRVGEIARRFFAVILLAQAGVLTLWSLFACTQAVTREREQKTWDFQRSTRLTPAELLVGKLLGEPVLAYFIFLCCFPIMLCAGWLGRYSTLNILGACLLTVAYALFLGLTGLWVSSLFESRSRGIATIGAIFLYVFVSLVSLSFRDTGWPAIGAFSPLAWMESMAHLGLGAVHPTLFGRQIPVFAMSLLLYATFGAWLALMLVRNLKRDYEDMRLLSRWEAVGCAAFLNFVVYALFYPEGATSIGFSARLASFMATINIFVLFAMGLASLTSPERLKVWQRERAAGDASVLSEEGLPWPWLAASALVAYGMLIWGLLIWRNELGLDGEVFKSGAVQMAIALIFVTRDVLFIQWCKLTRLRSPVFKGALYLGLYYLTAVVQIAVLEIDSHAASQRAANILTPAGIFAEEAVGFHFPISVFIGMAAQLGVIGILLALIAGRLKRPAEALPLAAH